MKHARKLVFTSLALFLTAGSLWSLDPIQWCGLDLDRCDEGGYCIQNDTLVASCRDCPDNSCQYW